MTDEALMAAYQKGELGAFTELVLRHEKPLWNFIRRFVPESASAEDVLQETFLRVVRAAPEWQPTAKFSTWVYTIARNLCTDHARRRAGRPMVSLDAPASSRGDGEPGRSQGDALAAPTPGPDQRAADRETAARIEAAVAALPAEQREVFLMREVMDMPFSEIAGAVGASVPTVKSRMRYALERLRKALGDLGEMAGRGPAESAAPTP